MQLHPSASWVLESILLFEVCSIELCQQHHWPSSESLQTTHSKFSLWYAYLRGDILLDGLYADQTDLVGIRVREFVMPLDIRDSWRDLILYVFFSFYIFGFMIMANYENRTCLLSFSPSLWSWFKQTEHSNVPCSGSCVLDHLSHVLAFCCLFPLQLLIRTAPLPTLCTGLFETIYISLHFFLLFWAFLFFF